MNGAAPRPDEIKRRAPRYSSARSTHNSELGVCVVAAASGRVRPWAVFTITITAALVWVGCSVEKHFRVLSFFFDGVPDPTIVEAGAKAVEFARRTGGTVYTHAPYAEERCSWCHTDAGGMMLATVEARVCVDCHDGVGDEHTRMHGPVAAGACLWCHAPHESTVSALLRVSPQQLCQQCHGATLGRRRAEIPEHSDPQRDCLECHYGHGGEHRAYLRTVRPADQTNP